MGVIYKTKDQIRDYILEAKKADPTLSCRQLAPLIKEKFGITLSKSTINTIFKSANLSAPVGRKPRKKAEIPLPPKEPKPTPEKPKEEVLAPTEVPLLSVEKVLPIEAPHEPIAPLPEEPKPAPEPVIIVLPPPVTEEPKKAILEPTKEIPEQPLVPEAPPKEIPVPTSAPASEPIEIKEDITKVPAAEEPEVLQPLEIKKDELLDGMGCFFLKAAEWQLSRDSILGSLLRKYLPQAKAEELNLNSDLLLYQEAFGLSDWQAFKQYQKKGLWAINRSPVIKSPSSLLKFAENLQKLRGLSLALFNEYQQYSLEIRYLKFTLEDGTVFYTDPQFRTLWQDSNIPETLSLTTYRINSYIKNIFQNHVQSIILQTAPGYSGFSKILPEFIWCCEGLPGKSIVKISLYNLKREEVQKITNLNIQKLYFILGFWPWQEEGVRFIREDLRMVKSFFLPEPAKEIFYSENASSIWQPIVNQRVTIRVGLIRDTALGWPRLGVLTNIPSEEKTMEEVIQDYLRRWPNQEEGYQDFIKRTSKISMRTLAFGAPRERSREEEEQQMEYSLALTTTDLRTNLNSLLLALNNLSQRYFFPMEYMRSDFAAMQKKFYLIAGQIETKNGLILVTLHPPSNYAFLSDLAYAVRRINESEIETPAHEKLIMKIA